MTDLFSATEVEAKAESKIQTEAESGEHGDRGEVGNVVEGRHQGENLRPRLSAVDASFRDHRL